MVLPQESFNIEVQILIRGIHTGLEPISIEAVKEIARKKGLKPGRVLTTASGVQLTKGKNKHVNVISWDEFEADLKKRKLAVYHYSGWLKIMKK